MVNCLSCSATSSRGLKGRTWTMNLKVFISWSKPSGSAIATALRSWLPSVFPEVDFVISTDISMGSKWENEIGKALDSCNFGIICVTPENANEPWLLFEAGALSKVQTVATVIPYCLEFSPAELPSPLSQFQGCAADEEGTRNLIRAINAQSRTLTESHLGVASK